MFSYVESFVETKFSFICFIAIFLKRWCSHQKQLHWLSSSSHKQFKFDQHDPAELMHGTNIATYSTLTQIIKFEFYVPVSKQNTRSSNKRSAMLTDKVIKFSIARLSLFKLVCNSKPMYVASICCRPINNFINICKRAEQGSVLFHQLHSKANSSNAAFVIIARQQRKNAILSNLNIFVYPSTSRKRMKFLTL